MWEKIKDLVRELARSNTDPESISLGVAIGAFICVLPLYGFHTVLFIIAAFMVRRANKLAILLGTNLSLPPTLPFITWAGYEIGRLVFWKKEYPPIGFEYFRHFDWKRLGDFYLPLFIGSVILGLICGVTAYVLTLNLIRLKRRICTKRGPEAG